MALEDWRSVAYRNFSANWRISPATMFGKPRELSNYQLKPPIGRQRKVSCARNIPSNRGMRVHHRSIGRVDVSRYRPIARSACDFALSTRISPDGPARIISSLTRPEKYTKLEASAPMANKHPLIIQAHLAARGDASRIERACVGEPVIIPPQN